MATKEGTTATLAEGLLGFQAAAPALQRDKINPHFRSKYISLDSLLEQIIPPLNANGLALIQQPGYVTQASPEGAELLVPTLTTTLLHVSGEKLESTMLLQAAKNDPQGQGAAITYARRQAAMSMLGLSADEDDDGNQAKAAHAKKAASAPAASATKTKPAPAAPTPSPQDDPMGSGNEPPDDPKRTETLVGMVHEIIGDIQRDYGDHPDGVPWDKRMVEKCLEWFNSDLDGLTTAQATVLVQRLRATKTKLAADKEQAG